MDSQNSADQESDIEILARETDTPVAAVQELYEAEHAKLDQAARIKTFVPALTHRRVKELLVRSKRAAESAESYTR